MKGKNDLVDSEKDLATSLVL